MISVVQLNRWNWAQQRSIAGYISSFGLQKHAYSLVIFVIDY